MDADHVILSDDSRVDTHTVAWVAGVTGAPLIAELGLDTERGRVKVGTDLQVPGHPGVFAAGDAAAVPDLTQPGKITPPTAQHATRQAMVLARNVAASMGFSAKKLILGVGEIPATAATASGASTSAAPNPKLVVANTVFSLGVVMADMARRPNASTGVTPRA